MLTDEEKQRKCFAAKNSVVVSQPPKSFEVTPRDFFLFPRKSLQPRGRYFQDIRDTSGRRGGTDRPTRDSKMSITALPLPVAEVLDPFHKLDRALLRRVKDKVKAILLEALKDPGV